MRRIHHDYEGGIDTDQRVMADGRIDYAIHMTRADLADMRVLPTDKEYLWEAWLEAQRQSAIAYKNVFEASIDPQPLTPEEEQERIYCEQYMDAIIGRFPGMTDEEWDADYSARRAIDTDKEKERARRQKEFIQSLPEWFRIKFDIGLDVHE